MKSQRLTATPARASTLIGINVATDAAVQAAVEKFHMGHIHMRLQFVLLLVTFAALSVYGTPAPAQSSTAWGETLAKKHCARCHSIGEIGESPMRLAPPFRDLSKRYPIEALEEALAEGIVVGHPAMPRFTFEPPEINALLNFISSLGAREPAPKGR